MSDPLRTDTSRATDGGSAADRDAKIEQLLLAGLDHYFSGRYEHAINIWTRALFLDRNHPRARAYIERARSALAERQRQSEELLQDGVAAFERGENGEARRLLQAAIDGGAPADQALAVLDRVNRLDHAIVRGDERQASRGRASAMPVLPSRHRPSTGRLALSIGGLLVVVAGALVAASWDGFDWRARVGLQDVAAAPATPIAPQPGPALPRRGETALARARTLAAGGHLRDALAALDMVRPTDLQHADAERLRGDIQRELLAGAATTPVPAQPNGDGRRP